MGLKREKELQLFSIERTTQKNKMLLKQNETVFYCSKGESILIKQKK